MRSYLNMSMKKSLLGAVGLLMLAIGIQLPVQAQSVSERDLLTGREAAYEVPLGEAPNETTAEALGAQTLGAQTLGAQTWVPQEEALTAETLMAEPGAEATELVYPVPEAAEVAQARRRRTSSAAANPDFIGIGGDVGTAGNISFAVISKLSLGRQIAVRPSILVGDDFAVLAPVTYEFSRFDTNAGGFRISPYAGVGASYIDGDNSSDLGLLVSGGVDVPVSEQFTVNAQANYAGIFSDSQNFGVTVGVGYNFGGLLR
ncbi:MAG: hypothetical protein DCF25_07135 [Leptolyngbya foveolarum]|uniref:Outer membrane protein beta-barrel domain-containing protein n=1 Tax=Leptolyngbya foveolarum TaxID=47253 RepID=A0A2W4W713_9CYAN|nr:MAG: hypothetical protein DCF25_07135 [Leptolyngbya foveolarum]